MLLRLNGRLAKVTICKGNSSDIVDLYVDEGFWQDNGEALTQEECDAILEQNEYEIQCYGLSDLGCYHQKASNYVYTTMGNYHYRCAGDSMSHSTGIWKASTRVIEGRDGALIGYVKTKKDGQSFEEEICCLVGDDRTIAADAALIAAAPDLLKIARLCLAEWEKPTEGVLIGELIARLSNYSDLAREAIKKAETEL